MICLAEYQKYGLAIPKELGTRVSGVKFPTATNMETEVTGLSTHISAVTHRLMKQNL
jgi:hypothetical protein